MHTGKINLQLVLLCCLCVAVASCTARHYRKSADRDVGRIISEKSRRVANMDPQFTIEQTNVIFLQDLPVMTEPEEAFGPESDIELGSRIVSLEEALKLAVQFSRVYQNQKEQLYLSALNLTLARNRYTPIFSGRYSGDYEVTTETASRIIIDPITQQPVTVSDELVEQHQIRGGGSVGARWLLRTGAQISAAFTTDFLRYLTGDPRTFTSSQLGATLAQPLWRGAGQAAVENLTQAERTVLYAVRDFTRYRRDFSIRIATSYYGVLENKDTARNNWRGLQNFKSNVERERALAEQGLKTQASLGLLQQSELNTETRWVNAVRAYRQALDQFKIEVGLPTDAEIVLDDTELERLRILHPDITVEEAEEIALVTRLDLANVRDQFADTKRKVVVAANGLKPQVDLAAAANISSEPNKTGYFTVPDINRYRWNAGLDLDLPLERTAERNTYRSALIAQEAAARELQQSHDEIKLAIRNDWRNLEQARRNFESSELGVELSVRRVQEQELRAEVGRGTARELVEAQEDLITQKNLRTQAVVAHTIARLAFWNDMGILYIKDQGKWQEMSRAK